MAGMSSELLAPLDRADGSPGAGELREATYELLRCGPGDRVTGRRLRRGPIFVASAAVHPQ